ncbi:MAG: hypothetical protein HYV41_01390 [Candidatus Magasanikbacteria bacterium]|nr:hypothetical protein [Candidatus Magasanikbacteria bacterium]
MAQVIDITAKSTKADILDAYDNLRKELQEAKQHKLPPAQQVVQKKEEEKIVEKTKTMTSQTIEQDIDQLKKKMGASLDEMLHTLSAKTTLLEDVRKAYDIESRDLQEVRNIQLADDVLQLLVAQYDEKKQSFEDEYRKKEYERQREEEEYSYTRDTKRRTEEREFDEKLAEKRLKFEQETAQTKALFAQREEEVSKHEQELRELHQKTEHFSQELEDAVVQAQTQVTATLTKEFEIEKRMLEQERRAEKNSLEARVESLQSLVQAHQTEIRSLKDALSQSNAHAQKLAATVIESVSGVKQMRSEQDERKKEGREE